jgi:hypothetical protein
MSLLFMPKKLMMTIVMMWWDLLEIVRSLKKLVEFFGLLEQKMICLE